MPRIPEDKIDEVRASANIVHYIQQFVNLKKAGQNFKGLCPFHSEKTPSFVVSPEKQLFKCFGCGKGGNVFTFIKEYEKVPFIEAVQKAAEFAGIALPKDDGPSENTGYFQQLYAINETACSFFEQNLWNGQYKRYLQYFIDRNLSEETIKKFRLGFAPDSYEKLLPLLKSAGHDLEEAANLGLINRSEKSQGWFDKFRFRVIFPFHNTAGRIIGFGGRKLREEQQPKYLNSPESPIYKKGEILYGLHQAIQSVRENGFLYIVEGYFDLLRLVEAGINNVAAVSGTAFTENQARLIRRYTKNVYIAFDGDSAGRKASVRAAQIIEKEGLSAFIVRLPDDEDPDTFILNFSTAAFEEIRKKNLSPLEFQIDAFFQENKNPPLEEKESFIENVLNQLAELPNQVKTGLYLHQLSDRLQINESLLVDQLNRFKRFRLKNKTKEEATASPKIKTHSGMYKAEAGILGLLLNGKSEIRNTILGEIGIDSFTNPNFIRLFEYLIQEYEETGGLNPGRLLDRFSEDEEMVKTITELSIAEYGDEAKFAKDCVFQLKRFQLEKRNTELAQLIKQEAASDDAVLHYQRSLMETKKQLNELTKQHRSQAF